MHVALITNGVVENVISADSVARAQTFYPACTCIERPDGAAWGPGFLFDGHTFTAPPPTPAPPIPLTKLEFLRRFTTAQRIAIRTSTDPVVVDALHLLDLADYVMTSDPDTVNLVGYLQANNFITGADAARILG